MNFEFFKNLRGILTRKAAKSITIFSLFLLCLSRLWFLDQDNTIKKAKNLDDLLRVGNTLLKLSHKTVGPYLEYCNLKVDFFSDRTCNQNSIRTFWNFKRFFFGIFNFFQNMNENTSHSSKNEFIPLFLGRIHGLTICFRN